jgi:hypothetical protein
MQDYLKDIVQHTFSLGNIDTIKVTGDTNETRITALAEDKSVVVDAKFKNPVPEFVGTFGMPNLGKLNTILGIPEYKEDAQLSITKRQDASGVAIPSGIHFENKAGDFKNDYRFMDKNVIDAKLKNQSMRPVKWHVDVAPSVQSIQRMRFQASANSEETTFTAKTDNGNLVFYFGDPSSHAGNFIFHSGVSGTLARNWSWPVAAVIAILGLSGDKTFKISDEGAAMITVDSGIAEYNYILPAQTK